VAEKGGTAQVTATGLLAGAAGTATLSVFERVEAAILGQRLPVYAAANVGGGLARRWLAGVMLPPAEVRFGYLLRWLYGASLGVLFMRLRPCLPRKPLAAGLCFGAGVFAFEVAVMPAVAATPAIRTWPRAERWLILLHTGVFGIATALAAEATRGRADTSSRCPTRSRRRVEDAG
jgi:hypothetical protein